MLYLTFSHFLCNTPCTTTSTWDIPSYTTRELLFLPTSFIPVCYSIFSFLSSTNQKLNLSHTCKNLLPTPLEDAQMPSLSGFSDFCPAYLSSPKEASGNAEAAFSGVSAMFEGLFLGILGCCQVLPSWKPVFIRVSSFL